MKHYNKQEFDNISVTAFIQWQGKALLVQRATGDDFLPGYWEQVGGKVEPDESYEDAVIREVKEEAGITVKPIRLYNQFEYHHPDGQPIHEYAYVCELIGKPTITLSSEHEQYSWITQQDLHRIIPMTDEMRSVVQKGFIELNR